MFSLWPRFVLLATKSPAPVTHVPSQLFQHGRFSPTSKLSLAFFLLVSLFLQMSTPSVSSFPASLCSDVTFSRRPALAILFSVAYLCPQPHSPAHSAPLISFTFAISLPSSIHLHSRGQRPWVYSLMLPEYHRHSLFIELLSGWILKTEAEGPSGTCLSLHRWQNWTLSTFPELLCILSPPSRSCTHCPRGTETHCVENELSMCLLLQSPLPMLEHRKGGEVV